MSFYTFCVPRRKLIYFVPYSAFFLRMSDATGPGSALEAPLAVERGPNRENLKRRMVKKAEDALVQSISKLKKLEDKLEIDQANVDSANEKNAEKRALAATA